MTLSPETMPIAADAAPSDALYFRGAVGDAVAGLRLPMDAGVSTSWPLSGPQRMLQMAKAESLISAIEQWLQAPWDLEPDPMAWNAPDLVDGCEAVVCTPALASVGTRLRLPWSALRVAPPSWLQSPHVAWPCMAAQVCIDHVLGDELHSLSAGGLLWLTPSFSENWPVAVRDPERRLPHCSGVWRRTQASLGTIALDPSDLQTDTAPLSCTVSPEASGRADVLLADPLSVPLEHWLGWSSPETRSVALPSHTKHLALHVRQADTVFASGELLALGGGYAVKVDATATQSFNLSRQAH